MVLPNMSFFFYLVRLICYFLPIFSRIFSIAIQFYTWIILNSNDKSFSTPNYFFCYRHLHLLKCRENIHLSLSYGNRRCFKTTEFCLSEFFYQKKNSFWWSFWGEKACSLISFGNFNLKLLHLLISIYVFQYNYFVSETVGIVKQRSSIEEPFKCNNKCFK